MTSNQRRQESHRSFRKGSTRTPETAESSGKIGLAIREERRHAQPGRSLRGGRRSEAAGSGNSLQGAVDISEVRRCQSVRVNDFYPEEEPIATVRRAPSALEPYRGAQYRFLQPNDPARHRHARIVDLSRRVPANVLTCRLYVWTGRHCTLVDDGLTVHIARPDDGANDFACRRSIFLGVNDGCGGDLNPRPWLEPTSTGRSPRSRVRTFLRPINLTRLSQTVRLVVGGSWRPTSPGREPRRSKQSKSA